MILEREIMKIGLVLAGGGGKGAYELGVWKALDELKLTKYITVFSGTSIGAFNSVLFAMNDMKKADELWEEVTMDKLVPISKSELIKRGIGLYIGGKNLQLAKKFLNYKLEHGAIANDGAIEVVEKYLDFNKIKENNKICYAACTKLSDFSAQGGAVRQHHQRTGRAGKARQVLPGLKIVTHVLRAVEIIRYHHIGVHALLLHPLPQQSELFSAVHCDYRLSFISWPYCITPPEKSNVQVFRCKICGCMV